MDRGRQTDRQMDKSDFKGCCLTNIKLPIRVKTKIYDYIEVATIL